MTHTDKQSYRFSHFTFWPIPNIIPIAITAAKDLDYV